MAATVKIILKLSGFPWTLATLELQLVVVDQGKILLQTLLGGEHSFWFAFQNWALIYPETDTLFGPDFASMHRALDFELSDLVSDFESH